MVAAAAMVGKAEKTWTGHHRNDSSSDLHRNRRMGEVEGNRRLCTEEVGGNYRKLWKDDEGEWEAKTLYAWDVGEAYCDMQT